MRLAVPECRIPAAIDRPVQQEVLLARAVVVSHVAAEIDFCAFPRGEQVPVICMATARAYRDRRCPRDSSVVRDLAGLS